jgi:hypothetical protein
MGGYLNRVLGVSQPNMSNFGNIQTQLKSLETKIEKVEGGVGEMGLKLERLNQLILSVLDLMEHKIVGTTFARVVYAGCEDESAVGQKPTMD